ncbi:MAG: copper homeostasis periplasmic binding protein CopC [Pseudomonadota bacterium]
MHLRKHLTLAAIAASASLLVGGTAFAHATLVKSDPAANSQVAAPKAITLTFDDELAPAFSKVQLAMSDGMKVDAKSAVSKDKLSIVATPAAALKPGVYTVTWQAAATEDGHKMNGKFTFTVK